jgi:hypothetical protein
MRIAFLMNERALRATLAQSIAWTAAAIEEYPTAAKAMAKLAAGRYDLVALHWKVHPGFGAGDAYLDELATLLPTTELNADVLYWEVALRVIDILRAEDSPNRVTPVVVVFPDLARAEYGAADELTREAVERDLAARSPAEAVFGSSDARFSEAVARLLRAPPA